MAGVVMEEGEVDMLKLFPYADKTGQRLELICYSIENFSLAAKSFIVFSFKLLGGPLCLIF
jgi:hypothetical protein